MAKVEHKVGDTFEYGEVTLRVTKQVGDRHDPQYDPCDQCYFLKHDREYELESCDGEEREDNTDIIFVEVENE